MLTKIKKINWLENLPEKYKFNSNDKIELFLNNDKEKVFINPNRGYGATHYTIFELMYYISTNSDKQVAFVTANRMSSNVLMDNVYFILKELFEDRHIVINKNKLYIDIEDINIKISFIHNENQTYGLKLNSVYIDNIVHINNTILNNVLSSTKFDNEAYIVANYTPLFQD